MRRYPLGFITYTYNVRHVGAFSQYYATKYRELFWRNTLLCTWKLKSLTKKEYWDEFNADMAASMGD